MKHSGLHNEEHIVKHINLDREGDEVKRFVRSLPVDSGGSILELEGEPVLRVLPAGKETSVDEEKIREAIHRRRDESRRLNEYWEDGSRGL